MTEWKSIKLGDVAYEISDRVDNPSTSGYDRFVGLDNFVSGDFKISNWSGTNDLVSAMKLFKTGDTLFARRNAYLKRVSMADFDGVCSGDAIVLRNNEKMIDGFLPLVLNTDHFWNYAIANAAGTMSKRVRVEDLMKYEFLLPPLDEQHRIASLLWASNNDLESKRNLLISTRKLKNALLEELFSKGVSEYRGKFRNTPIANVPESWNSLIIADVARVVRGSTPRPAGDPRYFNGDFIPWITVGELTKDDLPILNSTASMLTEEGSKKSRLMQEGIVVLSNSGFSLGIPKILGLTGCANDGVAAFLDLSELVEPLFLYYHLFRLTDYMRNVIAAGGDQPNLNTERIGRIPINLPSLDEQKKITKIFSNCDDAIIELNSNIEKSKYLCFQLLHGVLKN